MSTNARRVAVVLHMVKNQPWSLMVKEDLEAGLADSPEIHLEFVDPRGNVTEQLRYLETFLQEKVDALVVLVVDPQATKTILERYRAAKIPIIALDSDPGGDPETYGALILADNLLFGCKMGEFFVEASGGQADIVEICGIPGTTPTVNRSQGFREAIAPHPSVRIIESCTGNWLYKSARDQFSRILDRHPRIDGVFAQNDEMARGAWDAANAVGRAGRILITGVDALRGERGIQLVMRGQLAATLIYPSPGKPAAETLLAMMRGQPYLRKIVLQTSLLRSNERIRAWQSARPRR